MILFVSVDRRMDEWVPLNRIDMTRVVKEGEKGKEYGLDSVSCPGRRVTRNMKRKHDDINHIQKVRV